MANLGLELDEREGSVDMCKAMEELGKKMKVIGAIAAFRVGGASEEDIFAKVMSLFNVSEEYVLAILKAQSA